MKIYRESRTFDGSSNGILTIGNFDGFHRGHQELVRRVVQKSFETKNPSLLYSFDPHPLEVLQPQKNIRRLFPINNLIAHLKKTNLDYLIIESFSKKFSQLSAHHFFENHIMKTFKPSYIVVGGNFQFGCGGEGNIDLLKSWQKKYQFHLEVAPTIYLGDQVISSSLLRKAYKDRDFPLIKKITGRYFSIHGQIISGHGMGKKLGFPTCNIQTASILPKEGVYICQVKIKDQSFKAVMNVGRAPTLQTLSKKEDFKVEAHIIDQISEHLQGQEILVEILSFIRKERKFPSVSDLQKAITQDVQKAHLFFSSSR